MKLNSIGYLIKSGFKGIFSHGLMSFATVAIITACLIIMGAFSLLVVNINDMIAGLEEESNVVVAFIDENLSREEAVALEPAILAVPNVDSAQFVTREEAAEDFQADYDEALFDVITDDTFRDRYVVQLQDISLMEQTRTDLYAVDGVAKVNAHLEYAEGFITARNIVSVISLILIVILIVVSFFIMTNTIKLATFTRREEIAIMKMVGATNAFIRLPFVVEGFIIGIIAAAAAFFLEWGLYDFVLTKIQQLDTLKLFVLTPFTDVIEIVAIAYALTGFLVGVFGSLLSIRKFLKV